MGLGLGVTNRREGNNEEEKKNMEGEEQRGVGEGRTGKATGWERRRRTRGTRVR